MLLLNKIFDLVEDLINRFVRMRYEKKLLKEEKILNQITFDRKISISFSHYTSCFCEITDSEWIVFSSWKKQKSIMFVNRERACDTAFKKRLIRPNSPRKTFLSMQILWRKASRTRCFGTTKILGRLLCVSLKLFNQFSRYIIFITNVFLIIRFQYFIFFIETFD